MLKQCGLVTTILLFTLIAGVFVGSSHGCASAGSTNNVQYQQFQKNVTFWTAETERLRNVVSTLPPGKTRDDLIKQLTQAQYWLAFFNALVNPPTTQPTTQPM